MRASGRSSLLLILALLGAAAAARAATEVSVRRRPDKIYEVAGHFAVQASTTAVWGVLTDYDHIPAFVSSMRSSKVRETRADGSLLVEQRAVGDMFFLSKSMDVLLEVRRSPDALRFEDVGRSDFRSYAGGWDVAATPEGADVGYRLLARPDFSAPSFFMGKAMKKNVRQLLDQVRVEILRRGSAR